MLNLPPFSCGHGWTTIPLDEMLNFVSDWCPGGDVAGAAFTDAWEIFDSWN